MHPVLLGERNAIADQLSFDFKNPWSNSVSNWHDRPTLSGMGATRLIGINQPPYQIDIVRGQFENGLGAPSNAKLDDDEPDQVLSID